MRVHKPCFYDTTTASFCLWAIFFLLLTGSVEAVEDEGILRVCADANNLPYSNAGGEGFENKLAEMLADSLHRELEYTWWPQRRGFIRNTLDTGKCDVVMGVPFDYNLAGTTSAYYRSGYVVVSRLQDDLDISRLDDERLHDLQIGIHTIGDDYSNPPPAQLLAQQGIRQNVHGYSIYGNYNEPGPAGRLIDAVANREIDVAIAWGPIAGFFANQADIPLKVTLLSGQYPLPLNFDIAMGLRPEEALFREQVSQFLQEHQNDINSLLGQYHVPLVRPDARNPAAMTWRPSQ